MRAMGAAVVPPCPPFCTNTAQAILGSSLGANPTNQAWSRFSFGSLSASISRDALNTWRARASRKRHGPRSSPPHPFRPPSPRLPSPLGPPPRLLVRQIDAGRLSEPQEVGPFRDALDPHVIAEVVEVDVAGLDDRLAHGQVAVSAFAPRPALVHLVAESPRAGAM